MAYKGSTDQPARVDMFGISNYCLIAVTKDNICNPVEF